MWKVVWKDSLRFEGNAIFTSPYVPILHYLYLYNIMYSRSVLQAIIWIFFYIVFFSLTFFPVRLAKGMYLCPLTTDDRKKYIMTACYLRFGMLTTLYGLVLVISGIFLEVNNINIFLKFISGSFMIFYLVIFSIGIFSDPMETAKRRYYTKHKLPYPSKAAAKNPAVNEQGKKTEIVSAVIMGTAILPGFIGVMLPINKTAFNPYYLFYYIPSFIVSFICSIIFYVKYMDGIINASANREIFEAKNVKAGVFHAD